MHSLTAKTALAEKVKLQETIKREVEDALEEADRQYTCMSTSIHACSLLYRTAHEAYGVQYQVLHTRFCSNTPTTSHCVVFWMLVDTAWKELKQSFPTLYQRPSESHAEASGLRARVS